MEFLYCRGKPSTCAQGNLATELGRERLHKPLNTHHRALGASSFLCALHERRCQLLEVVRGVSNSSSHLMSIRDLYLSSEP